MIWYKRIITEKKKEVISGIILSIILTLAILLWHFALGKSFGWKEISPIKAPPLLPRLFYSALVFITFGAFLYWIKFYKFLHSLFVVLLKDWRTYKDVKGLVWASLILLVLYLLQSFVGMANTIISFFYNVFNLILYLFPPIGISLAVLFIGYFYYAYNKNRRSQQKTGY
jgi:hypothetical protein